MKEYPSAGMRIERPDEVKAGIEKAINTPGPVVVDLVVEREEHCFPIFPVGTPSKNATDAGGATPDKIPQGWR